MGTKVTWIKTGGVILRLRANRLTGSEVLAFSAIPTNSSEQLDLATWKRISGLRATGSSYQRGHHPW